MPRRFSLLLFLLLVATSQLDAQSMRVTSSGFVENRGQIVDTEGNLRPDILAVLRAAGSQVYLRRTGLSYVFIRIDSATPSLRAHTDPATLMHPPLDTSGMITLYRVDAEFVGANPQARITRAEASVDYTNYYLPHSPDGVTGVRSFGHFIWHDLYPNIDLVVRTGEEGTKSEFIVHPGGDPSQIRLRYSERVEGNTSGGVRVTTPFGRIEEEAPVSYEEIDGERREVSSAFLLEGTDVVYRLGVRDPGATLTIDPLTRVWGTYLGGSGGATGGADGAGGIATSPDGKVYVGGITTTPNFPVTTGAYQGSLQSVTDLFVARFNGAGARIWATYHVGNVGGFSGGNGRRVAAGPNGDVALSGYTPTTTFPTTSGAFQTTAGGSNDAVLVVFDSNGTRRWATYLGGTATDYGGSVAYDHSGNVLFVGVTTSTDFPVSSGALQTTYAGSSGDAFIAKFSSGGSLQWATYFSGFGGSSASDVTVDARDSIIVTGQAGEGLATTANVFQVTLAGAAGSIGSFILALDPGGNKRWATYFTSTATAIAVHYDYGIGVGVDASGAVTLLGATNNASMPTTPSAFQIGYGGGTYDLFLARLSPDATRLYWCTHLGGNNYDGSAAGLAVSSDGTISISGMTASTNFPVTTNGFQTTYRGDIYDGFITRFDKGGKLLWSSFYGSVLADGLTSVAVDSSGSLYVCGSTNDNSGVLVTPGAFQTANAGGNDALIVKFDCPSTTPRVDSSGFICTSDPGSSIILTADVGFHDYRWSTGDTTRTIVVRRAGTYRLAAVDSNGCPGVPRTIDVTANTGPDASVTASALRICNGDSAVLNVSPTGRYIYSWNTGANTARIVVRDSGVYRVTVTDTNGCRDTVSVHIEGAGSARPTIAPNGTLHLCEGDSLKLTATATGVVRWIWNSGDSTSSMVLKNNGRYAVTVIDTAGCISVSDTVYVVLIPTPQPVITSLNGNTFCEGDSSRLVVSGSYARYRWSTGDSTAQITVSRSGSYWVQIVDADGCVGGDTIDITVTPAPQPAIAGPNSACIGAEEVYTVADSIDLPLDWKVAGGTIVSGQGTRALRVLWNTPGSGSVGIDADNNGCSRSDSIGVTVSTQLHPQLAPTGTVTLCTSDSVVISAPAGYRSYRWNTGDSAQQIVVRDSGSYWVQVEATSGCTGVSDTVTVAQADAPIVAIAASGPVVLCDGDSVTLDAGTGYPNYRWSSGETTQRITVRTSGLYSVVVRTASGCTGTSDTVTVTSLSASSLTLTPIDPILCPGDSIRLDAGAGYASYRWSTGETSQAITVRSGGSYWVEGRAPGGCVAGDTLFVRTATPAVPVINRIGNTLEATVGQPPAVSYRWDRNGVTVAGATDRRLLPPDSGDYTVTVVDINGCTTTSAPFRYDEDVAPTGQLIVGDYTSTPGDRLSIAPYLVNTAGLVDGMHYTLRLRYARSLLLPDAGATTVGVTQEEREIEVKGVLHESVTGGEMQLDAIGVTVALGRVERTTLTPTLFTVDETSMLDIDTTAGSLALTGLCRNGGTRLVSVDGETVLKVWQPNPASDNATIDYEMIESGPMRLVLYDAAGREALAIAEGLQVEGRFRLDVDVRSLPSGAYTCVLVTPTEVRRQQVRVGR